MNLENYLIDYNVYFENNLNPNIYTGFSTDTNRTHTHAIDSGPKVANINMEFRMPIYESSDMSMDKILAGQHLFFCDPQEKELFKVLQYLVDKNPSLLYKIIRAEGENLDRQMNKYLLEKAATGPGPEQF